MFARILANLAIPYVKFFRFVDKRISGLEVKITKVEPGWLQGFVCHSMNFSDWSLVGLIGRNSWTIGDVGKDGKSTRFNENSKYFQAWFGFYAAISDDCFGVEGGEINIIDYNNMGVVDQRGWLKFYLGPQETTKLIPSSVKFLKEFKIKSGHTCHLFEGDYETNSENSDKASSFRIDVFARIVYKLFGGKKDYFTYKAFVPYCDKKTPFKQVRLKGYYGVVPFFDQNRHVVFYGCGLKENFPKLKDEIIKMMESAEIKARI